MSTPEQVSVRKIFLVVPQGGARVRDFRKGLPLGLSVDLKTVLVKHLFEKLVRLEALAAARVRCLNNKGDHG